jgi:hypothetical protein
MTIDGEEVMRSEVHTRNFRPVKSSKTVADREGIVGYTVEATYDGRDYRYTLTRGGATLADRERIRLPNALVYDNEMIFAVIRLAPITRNFSHSFRVPSPLEGTVANVTARTTSETVTGANVFGNVPALILDIILDGNRDAVSVRTTIAPRLDIITACGECDYCKGEIDCEIDCEDCDCGECEKPNITPFSNALVTIAQGDMAFRLRTATRG